MKKDKYAKIFLVILFAYAVFSFSVMKNFGITWDEPTQHLIGRAALNYIKGTTTGFGYLQNDLVFYGPFFEMANQLSGNFFRSTFHIDRVDAFHILIILSALIGLFFFFKLKSRMFGRKTAIWASIFLMLHPVFFAHSQYNSKDIPLFMFFMITLFLLYTGFKERKLWKIALGGVVCGLMLDTRIDGLLILPVFFGAYFLHTGVMFRSTHRKDWLVRLKRDLFFTAVFFAATAVAVYAAWPTLWHSPLFFFDSLHYFLHHGWPGSVLYFGKTYSLTAIPWSYTIFFLFATMPLVFLIFIAAGIFAAARSILRKEKLLEISILFLWPVSRFAVDLFPDSLKYDGVRHFLIVLPAFMVLAGWGFARVLEKIPKYFPKAKNAVRAGLITVVIVWSLIEFFHVFPFDGSYFNEVMQMEYPKNIDLQFDFSYWGETYRQGVDWLNQNAEPNSTYCVPIADHLLKSYPVRKDLTMDCSANTEYLMFFTRWPGIPENLESEFHYKEKDPVFRISKYDSDMLVIYKVK